MEQSHRDRASAGLLAGMPDMSAASGSAPVGDFTVLPQVDGYQVFNRLGSGGMGDVFRALQLSTRREVALKLMRGGFISETARVRFDREVELTARLDHPNVARIFDSGLRQGVFFYAMELIAGQPLDNYVANKCLETRPTLELFHAVCLAVAHAHQRAVIHRDLKPSNILVDEGGQPHVLDFGLAKALARDTAQADVSMEGQWSGTPAFMSPEQAAGQTDIDTRTDVYSLGIILYLLLCGRFPIDLEGTPAQMVQQVCQAEVPRPRRFNPRISMELESLLLKALARKPNDRYASAGELARDVENYLNGEPLSAQPATMGYFLRKRLWKYRSRVAVAIMVFVLLNVVAIVSYIRVVHARDDAIIANGNTAKALKNVEAQREIAEIRRAESLVAEGETHGRFGEWNAAKALFGQANEIFHSEGVSPLAAQIGVWNASRFSPAPLNVLPKRDVRITAMAASADGRLIVTGGSDGSIIVCDSATGLLLHKISAHTGAVLCAATSRDDHGARFVLTGGNDGTVALWDLHDGSLIQRVSAPAGWVTHVTLLPDGQTAVSTSGETESTLTTARDDTLCVWDLSQGRLLRTFNSAGRVSGIACSSDGTQLLTCGQELARWQIASAKKVFAFTGYAAGTTAAAFSPDGRFIVSGGADSSVILQGIDAQSEPRWKKSDSSGNSTAVVAVGFSSDGRHVVSAGEDHIVKVWDTATGDLVREYDGATHDLHAAAFSADGHFGFTAPADNSVWPWSLDDPAEARPFENAGGPVTTLSTSPDGRLAISRQSSNDADPSNGSSYLALWDIATGRKLRTGGWSPGPADSAIFSPDGQHIATLAGESITIWDMSSLKATQTFIRSGGPNVSAALTFSPNGKLLLTPAAKDAVSVFDLSSRAPARMLSGHSAPVTSIVISPDGRLALTGSRDHTAKVWDLDASRAISTLRGHKDAVNCVAFTPDGSHAITAGGNGDLEQGNDDFVIRIWEMKTATLVRELAGHTGRVRALAISTTEPLLASAGDDQTVRLWNWQTGKELRTIAGHTRPVLALAFVKGAVLSAGDDGTPRLWNLPVSGGRDEARHRFEQALQAIRSRPQDAAALMDLAQWYARNNAWDWAAELLSEAGPANSEPLLLARCYWQSGRLADAHAVFEKLRVATKASDPYLSWCIETVSAAETSSSKTTDK